MLKEHAPAAIPKGLRGSPSWHRRLRNRRSRLRRRVHRLRASGKAPFAADVSFLASHHCKPAYRELPATRVIPFRMVRKDKWQYGKPEHRYSDEPSGRPWHIWPGSWSASPKGRAVPKLRYDQMQLPASLSKDTRGSGEEPASGNSDMMREIQRMVTMARRADGKVRRLQDAKAKREAQWVLFEKKSKADFLEQKRLFEAEIKRITDEIEEATKQGVNASVEAQDLAANGLKPKEPPAEMEDSDPWSRLLQEDVAQEHGFLGETLRAARQASSAAPSGPSDGRMAHPADAARLLAATLAALPPGTDLSQLGLPPTAPPVSQFPGHSGPLAGFGTFGMSAPQVGTATPGPQQPVYQGLQPVPQQGPPPGFAPDVSQTPAPPPVVLLPAQAGAYTALSPGPGTRPAPYPPSPPMPRTTVEEQEADAPNRRPPMPAHTCQRDLSQTRVPTSQAPPREGVKDATKKPSNKGTAGVPEQEPLLEKLRAKREKELKSMPSALKPFGVGTAPTEMNAANPNGPPPGTSVREQAASLEYDDEDTPTEDLPT